MAHDITYFAVGAGLTGLLVSIVFPQFRYRLTVMTAGGIWATIPLWIRELGFGSERYGWLAEFPYAEAFWLHYTVTRFDINGDFAVRQDDATAALALGWLLLVVLIIEYRARTRKQTEHTVLYEDPVQD